MKEENVFLSNKLFNSMNTEDVDRFLTCANPIIKTFSPGEIVLEQGAPVDHLLMLASGGIELYKEDYEGNRSLVGSLTDGNTYGEQVIFGQEGGNAFQLVATTESKVVYIDKDLFYRPCGKVCSSHQALIRNMLTLLAEQANLLEKKITYLTAKSLRKKISLYLWEEYLRNNR
ncbi:MAG: cyclic nucleotide-binding domain-containing protein, partial [Bacillota bacterium]|nr:cyclic nucleotide-binding domain-containing protein [Bacillota bacterium]